MTLALAGVAHADELPVADAPSERDHVLRRGLSATASAGPALAALGYQEYALGTTVRAGLDTGSNGRLEQRWGGAIAFTRFAITGSMLDLTSVEGTYRIYPFRLPIYFGGAAGLVGAREAFDVTLGRGRRLDDVLVRGGALVGLSFGITLFHHVELEASYRQSLFAGGDGPLLFGQGTICLGGRP